MIKINRFSFYAFVSFLILLSLYTCKYNDEGEVTENTKNNIIKNGVRKENSPSIEMDENDVNSSGEENLYSKGRALSLYVEVDGKLTKYLINGSISVGDDNKNILIEGELITQVENTALEFRTTITEFSKHDGLESDWGSTISSSNNVDDYKTDLFVRNADEYKYVNNDPKRKLDDVIFNFNDREMEKIESNAAKEDTKLNSNHYLASEGFSNIVDKKSNEETISSGGKEIYSYNEVTYDGKNVSSIPPSSDSYIQLPSEDEQYQSSLDVNEYDPSHFYIKSDIRAIKGGASASSVPESVSVLAESDERNGWSIGGGYLFRDNQSIEISYVDLGTTSIDFETTTPPHEWDDRYYKFYPKTSQGLTVEYRYFVNIAKKIGVDASVGVGYFETKYDISREDGLKLTTYSSNEYSPILSAGVTYSFTNEIFASFQIENIFMEDDNINSLQIELGFKF